MKKALVRIVIFDLILGLSGGVLIASLLGDLQFAMAWAAGLFIGCFLGDLIIRSILWKKVRRAFLQKRIKRMESEVALAEEDYIPDDDYISPLERYIREKRRKLEELRLKLRELE